MDSVELVPPTPLMSELQAATPLIDVVIPFEVHVFAQSVEYEYDDALSVDVQVVFNVFNATHFVTAWAPVAVIAQSIALAIKIFDFIVLLLFFPNKKTTKNLVVRRLRTIQRIVLLILIYHNPPDQMSGVYFSS